MSHDDDDDDDDDEEEGMIVKRREGSPVGGQAAGLEVLEPRRLCAQVVASGLNSPDRLVVYGGQAYFVDGQASPDDTLESVPTGGGTPATLLSGASLVDTGVARGIGGFAVDAGGASGAYGGYEHLNLFHTPAGGGPTQTLASPTGGAFLGLHDGNVYFNSQFNDVDQVPETGGAPTTDAAGYFTRASAFDAAAAYFVDYNSFDLYRFDFATNAVVRLAGGNATEANALVIDGANVYLGFADGSVRSVPLAGGTVTTVAAAGGAAGVLRASDGTSLYFADGNALLSRPITGGQATTFATAPAGDTIPSVAVAGGTVYWTEASTTAGGGSIDKAAVTPTVTLVAAAADNQTATARAARSFDLGSFSETGATGPYTATVDWGDGTADTTATASAAGALPPGSHTYAAAGVDTVSVTVADAAGHASNAATFTVTVGVATPASTLVATVFKSTLPASVISGATVKGTVSVTVTNGGTDVSKGNVTVALYATTTGAIDPASTRIGTVTKTLTLRAGRSVTVAVPVRPVALPAGSYMVLAQVTDASGGSAASATGPALTVAPAHIALGGVVGAVSPGAVRAGRAIAFLLTVTNAGNVKSSGRATVAVYLSTDGASPTLPVATLSKSLTVKPGGRAVAPQLRAKVPAGTAAGSFYVLVVFTQGSVTFTAASASPISVG